MNKVKTLIYLSLLLVSIISCDNNKDEVQPKDLIIGKWQLVDLVNISDKDKYLNETLEIRTDNQYLHNNYN